MLCRNRAGAIFARPACRRRESPLDLSRFGAVGPKGDKGDKGDTGAPPPVETFHQIGQPGEPAFQGNWRNVGSENGTAAFFMDPFRIVHLKGRVVNGNAGDFYIFTLPPAYRPAQEADFVTPGCGGVLSIFADGRIGVIDSVSGCGLDGVTFEAGQ